jgi:RNA polymerase-interacting CarD/CdnL/TRCF family regulator
MQAAGFSTSIKPFPNSWTMILRASWTTTFYLPIDHQYVRREIDYRREHQPPGHPQALTAVGQKRTKTSKGTLTMDTSSIGIGKGDWIVHPQHGVGKISRLEKKTVGGKNQTYFRVEGSKYEWWIAINQIDDAPIRPLRKPSTFKRALRLLKRQPNELPMGTKERRSQIKEVLSSSSPAALCRVIRDLTALSREKRLPDEDKRNLSKYREALLQEWHLTLGVPKNEATELLDQYLAEGHGEEEES